MKRKHQCPKCDGHKLWVLESFRVPSDASDGVVLPVACHQRQSGGFLGLPRVTPQGRFDLWVCATCGYSELWARDLEGLREDPELGIRLVDATPGTAGPFR